MAAEAVVEVAHPHASEPAEPVGSVLDVEFEKGLRQWHALGEKAQQEHLAPVVESFGVGGP